MKNYIIKNYISSTTCRLLRKKLDNNIKIDNNLIQLTAKYNFTVDIREIVYAVINDVETKPKCSNSTCNNRVKFLDYSRGYRQFCCIRCSKNPKHLKSINNFGGKNLIRQTPITKKTIYFKNVREITRQTCNMNKDVLNPNNYLIGRCGVDGAYQIDHIISVSYGYENDIDPSVIGGLANLRLVPWRVNAVKNKYNTEIKDFNKIVSNYNKKDYHCDLSIFEFINKFCLAVNSRINTKLSYQWFINRNIESRAKEIENITSYLPNDEKMTFRVFSIHFGLYKNKNIITDKNERRKFVRDKYKELKI